jgi:hypothetical protein
MILLVKMLPFARPECIVHLSFLTHLFFSLLPKQKPSCAVKHLRWPSSDIFMLPAGDAVRSLLCHKHSRRPLFETYFGEELLSLPGVGKGAIAT